MDREAWRAAVHGGRKESDTDGATELDCDSLKKKVSEIKMKVGPSCLWP